jgi:hypothetical protein
MVSLSNHDDESMTYDTLRQAQGDTSGLFAISSNLMLDTGCWMLDERHRKSDIQYAEFGIRTL